MGPHSIGRLPVVQPGTRELAGIFSRHDVVRAYNMAIARKRKEQHLAEQIRLHTLTGAHVFEMPVADGAPVVNKRIRDIRWPLESVIASIRRGDRLIVPHGDTELHVGDRLTIVAAPETEKELVALLRHETAP